MNRKSEPSSAPLIISLLKKKGRQLSSVYTWKKPKEGEWIILAGMVDL